MNFENFMCLEIVLPLLFCAALLLLVVGYQIGKGRGKAAIYEEAEERGYGSWQGPSIWGECHTFWRWSNE